MTLYSLIIAVVFFAGLELWSYTNRDRKRIGAIREGDRLDSSALEDDERDKLINEIMEGVKDE